MEGWSARERGLWLRGTLALLSALSYMSVSWAGETASLFGAFALGMSLGSLYYLSRLEEGR